MCQSKCEKFKNEHTILERESRDGGIKTLCNQIIIIIMKREALRLLEPYTQQHTDTQDVTGLSKQWMNMGNTVVRMIVWYLQLK